MTLLEYTALRPRAKSKFFWTDDRADELRRLWTVEQWSSGQIALAFGVTRNTIIGKIARLGLQGRVCDLDNRSKSAKYQQALMHVRNRAEKAAKAPHTGLRKTTRTREKLAPGLPVEPFEPAPAPPAAAPCSLLELTDDQCRWPISDVGQEDFHFCGGRAVYRSYCAAHYRIAYTPRAPARPRAERKETGWG